MSATVDHPTSSAAGPARVLVRTAHPQEYDQVGALTVHAYQSTGCVHDSYEHELRDAARRAAHGELLVAVDTATGRLLGSVTLVTGDSGYAEVAGDGEAEFRMLAVEQSARGHGVGQRLVAACLEHAVRRHCRRVVISTVWDMRAAHRLYARLGFRRAPDRDWWPESDVELVCYVRELG